VGFQVVGVGAFFVACYFLFWWLSFPRDTRVLRVYLEHQGRPLQEDFTLLAWIPDMDPIKRAGHEGEASLQVPAQVTEVDNISIKCLGYCLRDTPPFRIVEGVIRLAMVRDVRPAPLRPDEFPPVSAIPDLPTEVEVRQSPKIGSAGAITLAYKNVSDENLRLLVFDCSRYYKSIADKAPERSHWFDFPFDAVDEFQHFNAFRGGTGWFCFFVRNSGGVNRYLGKANLYQKELTEMVVTGNELTRKAEFH
jgi:hypothetical protein